MYRSPGVREDTPCQEASFAPAAPAWACPGDLLLLLSDLPRGALTGGQRSCSGVEGGNHPIFVVVKKNATHLVDGFLGWEGHLLHLLHLNLRRPVMANYDHNHFLQKKDKSKPNLLVENHASLSLPSCIRVQISSDKIGGEKTLHRRRILIR